MYLDSGNFAGQQIIDSSFVKMTITPTLTEEGLTDYYGLSWWIVNDFDLPVYYMRGILGQYVIVIPDLDLVAVRLGHQRSDIPVGQHRSDLIFYVKELIKTYK